MVILHKLEDFIFELFPKAKAAGNDNDIPHLVLVCNEDATAKRL